MNSWLKTSEKTVVNKIVIAVIPVKNPEIPVLKNYVSGAAENFWKTFPHKEMPTAAVTKIDIDKLEQITREKKGVISSFVWNRAQKSIQYLRYGGPSFQSSYLPSCVVKNSKAATDNGLYVTDSICTWIKKGFVSGPFSSPPLENFRVNSILAVPQPGKIRICMNISLPEGKSFNDNIAAHKLEKMKMSSARNFGFSILEAGKGAIMSKFDFVDAYKNIPAKNSDLRLQGFAWLGKYFVENNMTFGGKPSVQNFDVVGATIRELVLTECEIPSKLVHRQLDDVPVVAPKKSGWCEEFSTKYAKMCKSVNMELAKNCPNNDKAFVNCTWGKVLGINFDTKTLAWSLPVSKKEKTLQAIKDARENATISLKELQKLMGRLNHVSQMAPFLNGFRHCLNEDLSKATNNFPKQIQLSVFSKKDLAVWSNFLQDKMIWHPIPSPREEPPLCTKVFVSDSAGFAPNSKWEGNVGCGVVGLDEKGDTILTHQLFWPKDFITEKSDSKGKKFGDKTCTLETIGVLLPFLLLPERLKNQHVICGVDCMGVVFGWENKKSKDKCASMLIKALHIIEAYLGSRIHVVHVPRVSNWESEVADNLSRERTTGFLEKQMLNRPQKKADLRVLTDWLKNPAEDWTIVDRLVDHVISTCTS